MTAAVASPNFDHLLSLTDSRGTFEHACGDEPRREHGYCTDDMARVLIVSVREPEASGVVNGLARRALMFLNSAQSLDGACRNRMNAAGRWTDSPNTDDHWGRMLWALGTAAAHSGVGQVRRLATIQFERGAAARSVHLRSMSFAAIGAAELLTVDPENPAARGLLADYVEALPPPSLDPHWCWPESRLAYANAMLAEAMIAAGAAVSDAALRRRGLDSLRWLLGVETSDGHLSPTPVGGCGRGDTRPGFDQQPIEVASMADACARAAASDPDPLWVNGVLAAAAWFGGANDVGLPMWDPKTGAGFDGLHADRVNQNCGAESTIAVIATFQQARALAPAAR